MGFAPTAPHRPFRALLKCADNSSTGKEKEQQSNCSHIDLLYGPGSTMSLSSVVSVYVSLSEGVVNNDTGRVVSIAQTQLST